MDDPRAFDLRFGYNAIPPRNQQTKEQTKEQSYRAELLRLNAFYKEDLKDAIREYSFQMGTPTPQDPEYRRYIASLQDIHNHYKEARGRLNEKYSNYEHWMKIEAERRKKDEELMRELFKDVQF
jgi:hypothetical protein